MTFTLFTCFSTLLASNTSKLPDFWVMPDGNIVHAHIVIPPLKNQALRQIYAISARDYSDARRKAVLKEVEQDLLVHNYTCLAVAKYLLSRIDEMEKIQTVESEHLIQKMKKINASVDKITEEIAVFHEMKSTLSGELLVKAERAHYRRIRALKKHKHAIEAVLKMQDNMDTFTAQVKEQINVIMSAVELVEIDLMD